MKEEGGASLAQRPYQDIIDFVSGYRALTTTSFDKKKPYPGIILVVSGQAGIYLSLAQIESQNGKTPLKSGR